MRFLKNKTVALFLTTAFLFSLLQPVGTLFPNPSETAHAASAIVTYDGGDITLTPSPKKFWLKHGASGNFTFAYPFPEGAENITETYIYASSNEATLPVSSDGSYVTLKKGKVTLTVDAGVSYTTVVDDVETQKNITKQYTFTITVIPDGNQMSLDTTSAITYFSTQQTNASATLTVNILGPYTFVSSSDITYTSSDKSMPITYSRKKNQMTFTTSTIGTTTLTVTIYDSSYKIKWKTRQVYTKKPSYLKAAGKSFQIGVKALKYDNFSWVSSNPEVADVTETGYVTTKKAGNTIMTGTYGDTKVGCVVNVTTKKKVNAINLGKLIGSGIYSQPRRMENGYWDCSSLVWRSYINNGCDFGVAASKGWAPTAAGEALWMNNNGKIYGNFSWDNSEMKMQAGDVLFFTGANNGRYLGIYHIEMFTGYEFYRFDASGNPVLGTNWATHTASENYGGDGGDILGRP